MEAKRQIITRKRSKKYILHIKLFILQSKKQKNHTAMISSSAFNALGFMMRLSKNFKLAKSLKSLYYYCALVRPILEYRIWICYQGSLHYLGFRST